MTVVTDNFNRANNTSLGTNYTEVTTNLGRHLTISSNTAVPSALDSGDSISLWTHDTFSNDQYAQAKITTSGTLDQCGSGVIIRGSGGNEGTGTYIWVIAHHGATNNISIAEIVGGTYALKKQVSQSWTDGDTWRIEATGTSYTIKLNGTTVTTTTESSVTSGSPGPFYSSTITSTAIDDFEGGDLAAGMPPGLGPEELMDVVGMTANQSAMMR